MAGCCTDKNNRCEEKTCGFYFLRIVFWNEPVGVKMRVQVGEGVHGRFQEVRDGELLINVWRQLFHPSHKEVRRLNRILEHREYR